MMFTKEISITEWLSVKKLYAMLFIILSILVIGCEEAPVNDTYTTEIDKPSAAVTPVTTISPTDLQIPANELSANISSTPYLTPIPTHTSTPHPTSTIPPTPMPSITSSPVLQGNLAILTTDRSDPQYRIAGSLHIVDLLTQESIFLFDDVASVDWSPDGERLVFSAMNRNTFIKELFLVNGDGTNLTKLDLPEVGEAHRLSPAWSPDGTKIAFSQPDAGEYLIHILDLEENSVQFLTKGIWPAWSSDGSKIAFLRLFPEGAYGDIFIIDIDGNNLQQVTENIEAGQPVWSPDGQYIAFYGLNRDNQENGLFVLNPESMQSLLIVPHHQLRMPTERPSWLPNSSQILFAQNGELFFIHVDDLVSIPLNLPSNYYYLAGMLRPS